MVAAKAQTPVPGFHAAGPRVPARVDAARRFLAQRGFGTGQARFLHPRSALAKPMYTAGEAVWQPLGPQSVTTPYYGAVSGRVSSIAFDPSDPTGNTVYVGTTGGGIWSSQNAATGNPGSITFSPLTDSVGALNGAVDPSISIGAVTVQPGGTGVILAGTGDPNDALDSYYGAGILRSTDDGTTWTLIQQSSDLQSGTSNQNFGFEGLGFAGFAWSTASPQTVVAAVSEAYEGLVVNAPQTSYDSSAGLYYSTDAGATWHLAEIQDAPGQDVQGPHDVIGTPYGNSVTAVVWNPLRNEFLAAVRFHGYYSSPDGVTWTRLQNQPGTGLGASTGLCPTNTGSTGSPDCPIFRGMLAVNSQTGDTFAWSVDENNQDQGLWQDVCSTSGSACSNTTIAFGRQWSTTALEVSDPYLGDATIENGDYDLALAAVPYEQDTLLMAGDNDLWKCSLAAGCQWRNTTNALTCLTANVAPYQHAVAWNAANPLNVLIGNDSGLWRSMDDVGETGAVCNATDSTHFQNLNSGLGSLAEIASMPQVGASSYTMMLGLGVNGTAGVKSTSGPTAVWPQILDGEGGPVAIDPSNANNWYVNNGAGVSIHECSQSTPCMQADFGTNAQVTNADVGGDGNTMTEPAPFIVDPLDPTQLLIGTCRVWRGPANGTGWSSANAVSSMLDSGSTNGYCDGNALIRTIAAMKLVQNGQPGGEIVYVGTYGSLDGGATLAGQVLSATMNASGQWSSWTNLTTLNHPVTNDTNVPVNVYGFDISSIYIDPSDTTGQTVYVTVEGMPSTLQWFNTVYKTTNGGANWTAVTSNLPYAPANSIVVDPVDPNTVYLATDAGVYATQQIATCSMVGSECWQPLGAGLPAAPVVAMSAAPASSSTPVLVAGTYGRGLWQIPLLTAGTQLTTATIAPGSLSFAAQAVGTASATQTLTVTNTGGFGLSITSVSLSGTNSGDFSEIDNCAGQEIQAGTSCAIQVTFAPTAQGTRTATVTVAGNISGGSLTASLTGNAAPPGAISITQGAVLNFGNVETGQQSQALSITVQNSTSSPVPVAGVTIVPGTGSGSATFSVASNSCSPQVAASSDCQLSVVFAPTASTSGLQTATLSIASSALTAPLTANLYGTGTSPPTDTLSCVSSPCTSLGFPATIVGGTPSTMTVTLTNSGQNTLTSISPSVSGPFEIGTNTCTANLGANSSCAISVEFVPTAAGSASGTLTISDILKTQTVSLSGTGLSAPVIAVSPTTLTFSSQAIGSASAAQTITVSNAVASTDGASLSDIGFSVTGASASSFSVASNTCVGETLAPGASCTANVVFTPASAGGNAATLAVASGMTSAKIKPATVALSGTGTGGAITVNPAQLTFAATAVGQTSAAQTVTVTNSGTAAATGLAVAVSGPFGIAANNCGTSLAVGAGCTVGVNFTPLGTGQLTGQLSVTSALSQTPVTVTLGGIGGATGAVQFSPASVSFPVTGVGQTSSPVTVTITNVDTANALNGVALTASAGFALTGNNCSATLAPGASCTVDVEFAPAAAGAQTGTLSLASSSFSAPATEALSGTGFDFTVAASGSSNVTVASGQTASFALTVTPVGGLAGTFSFSCGTVSESMPTDAACGFNPSSLAVAAGASGTETVSVTTSQSAAALARPRQPGDFSRRWLLVCGLVVLPFAFGRRRGLLLAVMLAIAVGAAVSCSSASVSGGGGGGGTAGNTPPGTYSIPVTVSAYGTQHSITLTLTVD